MDIEQLRIKLDEEDDKVTNEPDYSYIQNISITQRKVDLAFKTLVDGFDEALYVIPKYQRKYIWSQEQVENLAVSLIRGLPIPPIYVYKNKYNQMEILDGQQRMLSLLLYYKGKYIKNKSNTQIELQKLMSDKEFLSGKKSFGQILEEAYQLKDVRYKLKYIEDDKEKVLDITYEDLPPVVKRSINFANISVIEIDVDSNDSNRNRVLYKVFENLNSAGTPLKNQELRNGVYQSKFYDMLHDINDNNLKWREVYGEKHPNSKDVELLLRFCAVQYNFKLIDGKIIIENYNNSYPKLLNDFSDIAINFDDETILYYRKCLEEYIDRIEVAEKKPRLLLESVYLASQYIHGDYIITDEFYDQLLSEKEYTENTLSSSSSKSKVSARFNYVYNRLQQYVNGDKK